MRPLMLVRRGWIVLPSSYAKCPLKLFLAGLFLFIVSAPALCDDASEAQKSKADEQKATAKTNFDRRNEVVPFLLKLRNLEQKRKTSGRSMTMKERSDLNKEIAELKAYLADLKSGKVALPEPVVVKGPMTREALKAKIIGKTPAEVIAAIGRPDDTTESSDGVLNYWSYKEICHDPITGKIDGRTSVQFKGGIVKPLYIS